MLLIIMPDGSRSVKTSRPQKPSNERGYPVYNVGIRTALLVLIAAACTAACVTTGGTKPRPRPFPGAPLPPEATPAPPAGAPGAPVVVPPAAPSLSEIVDTALMLRGVPYRNGGTSPASGFDCSGFVQWVFAQHGIYMPRDVEMQFAAGRKINVRDLHPGDLIFFHTEGNGASHVGVAIGRDEFVHAPSSKGVVRVERFTTNYWRHRIVGARRIADVGTTKEIP